MEPLKDLIQQLYTRSQSFCSPPSKWNGRDRWHRRRNTRDYELQQLAIALRHQCYLFETGTASFLRSRPNAPQADAELCTLLDTYNGVTALFGYCAAAYAGYEGVVEEYHRKALLQYVSAKELYDQVWGAFIPDQFKQEASEMSLGRLKKNELKMARRKREATPCTRPP